MTIDEEGMLWIAHWGGRQVSRWNPHTGKKMEAIHLPVSQCTSCAFGGNDLDELYIRTASFGLTEEEREKQPLAGGLFKIQLALKGMPAMKYNG